MSGAHSGRAHALSARSRERLNWWSRGAVTEASAEGELNGTLRKQTLHTGFSSAGDRGPRFGQQQETTRELSLTLYSLHPSPTAMALDKDPKPHYILWSFA
uniref:Uncharacterized protein n=1 Tax=Knipowitschia caucasica TaxID=637954 RepID=A0AAV2L3R0_KNICA